MSLGLPKPLLVPVAIAALVLPLAGPASAATVVPVVVTPVALPALADVVVGSAVAPNGDRDPYSITVVPSNYTGSPLRPGDVLVGDVSNAEGVRGRGHTILRFSSTGTSVFSTSVMGPVATAFNGAANQVWAAGYGSADNGTHGAISVLRAHTPAGEDNPHGVLGDDHGAWGVTTNHSTSNPITFWSNADGTLVRDRKIASPYDTSTKTANIRYHFATLDHSPSPSFAGGTVAAPQGMVWDGSTHTLYVADTALDQVVALHNADTAGTTVTPTVVLHGGPLHQPRGIAIDPLTGNLLVSNGAVDNNLIEMSTSGIVVNLRNLDPTDPAGGITGIATTRDAAGHTAIYYGNVNSDTVHVLLATGGPVLLDGPTTITARYGASVAVSGHAPAGSTVTVWFHAPRTVGYRVLRTLQADFSGAFTSSFKPNDDTRYYAQVGATVSASVLEVLTPNISGDLVRVVQRGHTVVLFGHGAPHSSVLLHFHKAGTGVNDFSLLRSVHVEANGVWSKAVSVAVDYRVYASRGVLHPYSPRVLLLGY